MCGHCLRGLGDILGTCANCAGKGRGQESVRMGFAVCYSGFKKFAYRKSVVTTRLAGVRGAAGRNGKFPFFARECAAIGAGAQSWVKHIIETRRAWVSSTAACSVAMSIRHWNKIRRVCHGDVAFARQSSSPPGTLDDVTVKMKMEDIHEGLAWGRLPNCQIPDWSHRGFDMIAQRCGT